MTKKGISRASADVGFIFIAYNLRRMLNLTGINEMKQRLRACCLEFAALCQVQEPKKSILSLLDFHKSLSDFFRLTA